MTGFSDVVSDRALMFFPLEGLFAASLARSLTHRLSDVCILWCWRRLNLHCLSCRDAQRQSLPPKPHIFTKVIELLLFWLLNLVDI